jgi:hypothetical protein
MRARPPATCRRSCCQTPKSINAGHHHGPYSLFRHVASPRGLHRVAGWTTTAEPVSHAAACRARRAGLSDAKIAALEIGADTAALSPLELQVMQFADKLVRDVKAPDDMFDAMKAQLSTQALAELVLTIGFYMMVSRFLENFEVDIEPDGTSGRTLARRLPCAGYLQ